MLLEKAFISEYRENQRKITIFKLYTFQKRK